MMKMIARPVLSAAAVAACLLISAASHAIVYFGSFDPPFGSPLDDLYYKGTVHIKVDDACVASTGWKAPSGTCAMSLLSASVTLSDAAAPNTPLQTVGLAGAPTNPGSVTGIYVQDVAGTNEVTGLDTIKLALEDASTSVYTGPLWLQFESGHFGEIIIGPIGISDVVSSGAFLYAEHCNSEQGCGEVVTNTPGTVTFVRVPEPGSLALILAALSAGWFLRRRVLPA